MVVDGHTILPLIKNNLDSIKAIPSFEVDLARGGDQFIEAVNFGNQYETITYLCFGSKVLFLAASIEGLKKKSS